MAAIILFGIFFLLLFMNMPIAFALGISSLSGTIYYTSHNCYLQRNIDLKLFHLSLYLFR